MKMKYLLLSAMALALAGCVQTKQTDVSKPLQQLSTAVQGLNQQVATLSERIDMIEERSDAMKSEGSPFIFMTVSDAGDNISFSIPADWVPKEIETPTPSLLSALYLKSPDFKSHEVECDDMGCLCTPTIYDEGAAISVKIFKRSLYGETVEYHQSEGGATNSGVTQTNTMIIDGQPAVYHTFRGFCGGQEGQLDAHIEYKDAVYTITFNHSAKNHRDANKMFLQILASVKFLK